MTKKTFYLFTLIFLLNGCVESVALLGSSVGGASSGKMVQSTLQSTISYGVKKQTGKTPLGHALAYAEENNPDKKKETCISFIEKTRSEFCTIAKKKISLTNKAIKEKVAPIVKFNPKADNSVVDTKNEPKINNAIKDSNFVNSFYQLKKSPRELAIIFQNKLKNLQSKYTK
ncbi:hypothetical protein N8016_01025 [Pelagibacteraceae bacterium]|nr:hypothetical protein [Pelagibacteraceae bacterium]